MRPGATIHHVLWTGGWDSTFRVLDLVLTHGREVQPWYVVDPERRTTQRELRQMRTIVATLAERDPAAAQRIRPLVVRRLADIRPHPEVTAAAREFRLGATLAAQYEWLASFVRQESVAGMELAIEDGAGTPSLAGVAVVRQDAPAPDDWWLVPRDGNPVAAFTVFGEFRLPVLGYVKTDLEAMAADAGFADLMELTWFCRWPTVLGRPCGFCVPCTGTRSGGLGRRVPEPTPLRQRLHRTRWGLHRRLAVLRANAGSIPRRLGGRRGQ